MVVVMLLLYRMLKMQCANVFESLHLQIYRSADLEMAL